MITVATVCRSGSIYTPELWVDRLYHQVRKWMPDVPWQFRCLTDTPMPWQFEYPPRRVEAWDGYATIPLAHDWPGWWSKLELFRPGIFEGLVLYLDLDTVITGPLDWVLDYGGTWATLEDFYTSDMGASGVMLWQAGIVPIYEAALRTPPIMTHERSDHWWGQHAAKPDFLQTLFPGEIGSYKVQGLEEGPGDFSVCCMHGHPKQFHLPNTWVDRVWRGGEV